MTQTKQELQGAAGAASSAIAKHTPGPWAVKEAVADYYDTTSYRVVAVDGSIVAYVGPHRSELREDNAKLIAAAPTLADALERAYRHLDEGIHGERPSENAITLGADMRAALRAAGRLP